MVWRAKHANGRFLHGLSVFFRGTAATEFFTLSQRDDLAFGEGPAAFVLGGDWRCLAGKASETPIFAQPQGHPLTVVAQTVYIYVLGAKMGVWGGARRVRLGWGLEVSGGQRKIGTAHV